FEQEWVDTLTFSPEGRLLAATGNHEKDARLWDVTTGEERGRWHGDATAFSDDARTVAVASRRDGEVRLWEAASAEGPRALRESLPRVRYTIAPRIDFRIPSGGPSTGVFPPFLSPGGKLLVAGGGPGPEADVGVVRLWDAATGKQLAPMLDGKEFVLRHLAFSA